MAKQITLPQFEELKRLNNNLYLYSSIEYKEHMVDHVLQILNDVEFLSTFHRKLIVEYGIYYFHKDTYDFNFIAYIISDAVQYYEKQVN